MRLHHFILACAGFATASAVASLQASMPDADYLVLAMPQPVQALVAKAKLAK